jgi:hypothetical protein
MSVNAFIAEKKPSSFAVGPTALGTSLDMVQPLAQQQQQDQVERSFAQHVQTFRTSLTAMAPQVVHKDAAKAQDAEAALPSETPAAQSVDAFEQLPRDVLEKLQTAVAQSGVDSNDSEAMMRLANDPSAASALARKLNPTNASELQKLTEVVRQWQLILKRQLEMIQESKKKMAAKKRRPVWRCNACGRYGCNVAPYIESYQDIPDL